MMKAVEDNNLFKNLISQKSCNGNELNRCLLLSIKNNYLDCIQLILDRSDVDFNLYAIGRKTPAMMCAEYDNVRALNLFIKDPRCQINEQSNSGETALHYAVKCTSEECVRELLKACANTSITNNEGNTPLLLLSKMRHPNVGLLKLLLSDKSSVNKRDKEGRTALHYACAQAMGTELVLASGASPDVQDLYGNSPLHIAAIEGFDAVVFCLITYNCNVNLANTYNRLPIHYLAMKGHWKVFEALVQAGGLLDVADELGKTPLMYAIENNRIKAVIALLKFNCCPDKTSDKFKLTPIEISLGKKFFDILKVLLIFGSELTPLWDHMKNNNSLDIRFKAILQSTKGINDEDKSNADMDWSLSWMSNCCDLQHLCRIKIREFMRESKDYAQHLNQLPKQTKDYVLFNNLDSLQNILNFHS